MLSRRRSNSIVELTPEEEAARHVSAMHDSVNLIDELIAAEATDDDSLNTIERNYRHLEIMLTKPIVADSSLDLSAFQPCIDAAKVYLEAFELPAE